ncbi:hypothetical protein COLO4_04357 [Corchorus olitorius]|uniref:Uncharacterized protein n=1 Tax=Corchorus olitorius TaxID=93759 RepID=A0A1R3KUD5_9ROSI|nr:hypothetical protein COLO4_04357 [Corchorus olitorius]
MRGRFFVPCISDKIGVGSTRSIVFAVCLGFNDLELAIDKCIDPCMLH